MHKRDKNMIEPIMIWAINLIQVILQQDFLFDRIYT